MPRVRAAAFGQEARIRHRRDFQRILRNGRRTQAAGVQIVYLPNGEAPRLGLATPKRALPRAVDRHRFRRVVREAFRLCRTRLPPFDFLVMGQVDLSRSEPASWRPRVEWLLARFISPCNAS